MTKDKFEQLYCKNSNITTKEYDDNFITLPCQCSERGCKGWAAVCNNKLSIKAHNDLYGKEPCQ
jgi:hypothetical protein